MNTINPYNIVRQFEETIAGYSGSEYAVAVESGTAAIFLSLMYRNTFVQIGEVLIPKFTYPSVPASIIHAGGKVKFDYDYFSGVYELEPYKVYDGALRFKRGMYKDGLHCLSFHAKKHLPIGRGGMILTDDLEAYKWLKKARFDGRDEVPLEEQKDLILGWNMYLTPEQAARGLTLFQTIKDKDLPDLDSIKQGYKDCSQYAIFK